MLSRSVTGYSYVLREDAIVAALRKPAFDAALHLLYFNDLTLCLSYHTLLSNNVKKCFAFNSLEYISIYLNHGQVSP